jgi:hypothetical protein
MFAIQNNNINMIPNIEEAKNFDKWMRKISNIHYSNNDRMLTAYSKIEGRADQIDRHDFGVRVINKI